jgi:hypothetical protein
MPYVDAICSGGSPLLGFGTILGSDWRGLVFLAILISSLALAIVYMFASFLRNAKLIAWSRHEVLQMANITVLMLAVITVVWGMCSFDMTIFSPRYANNPDYQAVPDSTHAPSAYAIADDYLWKVTNFGKVVFIALVKVNFWIGLGTKVVWEMRPLGIGTTTVAMEGFSQISNLMFFAMSGFVISFLITLIQRVMVEYLLLAILNFLLPLGILLRAITPTRQFGGGLIGFSISMLLFYPIFLVFNDMIMFDPFLKMEQPLGTYVTSGNPPTGSQSLLEGIFHTLFVLPIQAGHAIFVGFSDFMMNTILHMMFFVVIYFIAAVALPALNFIVLIEMTRGMSRLFGEEIDVTNLTRLI